MRLNRTANAVHGGQLCKLGKRKVRTAAMKVWGCQRWARHSRSSGEMQPDSTGGQG